MIDLLKDDELDWSDTVANNAMNRERAARGSNSYTKDLRFDPIEYLENKLKEQDSISWLDVCCGRGNALIEASRYFHEKRANVSLKGIDLVDFYNDVPDHVDNISFETAAIRNWSSRKHYDLITCVHGLHYVGDKLFTIKRLMYYLRENGLFIANFDAASIKDQKGGSLEKSVRKIFRRGGIGYENKKKILRFKESMKFLDYEENWTYMGADDKAGTNYTGQRAVASYYFVNGLGVK